MMTTSARKSLTATDRKRRCASRRRAPFFHATVGNTSAKPDPAEESAGSPCTDGSVQLTVYIVRRTR